MSETVGIPQSDRDEETDWSIFGVSSAKEFEATYALRHTRVHNDNGSESVYDENGVLLYISRSDSWHYTHTPEWVTQAIEDARQTTIDKTGNDPWQKPAQYYMP